jgi:hypothetical protein
MKEVTRAHSSGATSSRTSHLDQYMVRFHQGVARSRDQDSTGRGGLVGASGKSRRTGCGPHTDLLNTSGWPGLSDGHPIAWVTSRWVRPRCLRISASRCARTLEMSRIAPRSTSSRPIASRCLSRQDPRDAGPVEDLSPRIPRGVLRRYRGSHTRARRACMKDQIARTRNPPQRARLSRPAVCAMSACSEPAEGLAMS